MSAYHETTIVSKRDNFGSLNIRSNYWSFYDTTLV